MTDTESLDRFGLLGRHTVLAHSNLITSRNMDTIRARRSGVAHCPLSNAYFSSAVFPLKAALEKGLHVGLGSDISGGPSASLFDNMRSALLVARLLESGVDPDLGPAERSGQSGVWIDFREIQDDYMRGKASDYFENSRSATLVQRRYAIENPAGFAGYGENCWGISASNGPGPATHRINGTERRFFGYMARGVPDGPDDGTIAPSAVAASLPFAPEIVAPALRYFATLPLHENGAYGLEAAFNATIADLASQPRLWVSPVHVGISRGPIVLMIENHRTGLIWGLMRGCPYVVAGLRRAGFSGGWLARAAQFDAED